MFTFVLWKGNIKTIPPHKTLDMAMALSLSNNFLKAYSKVQVLSEDGVIKEFINPNVEG